MIRVVAIAFMCCGAVLSAAQAPPSQADFERCKAGDRRACEAVGVPKPLAADLAAVFREADSSKKRDREDQFLKRLNALANPDAYVVCFRLGLFIYEFEKRVGPERVHALVLGDADPDVRKRALLAVSDPAVLAKVATQDADAGLRGEAAGRLADTQVLEQVALHDPDMNVRVAALANAALQKDAALLDRLLAQMPPLLRVRSMLTSGYWVLGPGAGFHLLPIEPAEGVEVLKFRPDGTVRLLAGTAVFGERTYEVLDGPSATLRIGQRPKDLSIEVTPTELTLTGASGKATYSRVADIYKRSPDAE